MEDEKRVESEAKTSTLVKDIVQLLLIVLALLILRLIVVKLPMVGGSTQQIGPLLIEDVVIAAAWTLIILTFIRFAFRLESAIAGDDEGSINTGKAVRLIMLFFAVIIAYLTFRGFALAFLGNQAYIFSILMLIAAVAPIVFIAIIFYGSIEKISESVINTASKTTGAMVIKCDECGAALRKFDKFCPKCGQEKVFKEPAKPPKCPECGVEMKSDQVFCTKCGYKIDVAGESKDE